MKTMLFNPYTGTPRHPGDIKSDPQGLLIVEPDAPMMAAPQPAQTLDQKCMPDGIRYMMQMELTAGQIEHLSAMARDGENDAVWKLKELPPIPSNQPGGPCPGGMAATTEGQPGWAFLTAAAQPAQARADLTRLIARLENQWHRMGELWERCQGKGWPGKEDAEFRSLRDEKTPATRAAIVALITKGPAA